MPDTYTFTISYGKLRVPVYRVYAQPLSGLAPITESNFTGRSNTLFALEVDVEVFGNNFLPAYTEGDNSNVVATDSMKNFVLRQSLEYTGSTIEGLIDMLGRHFLETYPQMEGLRLSGRELPFQSIQLSGDKPISEVLFSRSHGDFSTVTMDFARAGDAIVMSAHHCGRVDLELFKVTGSSFTHFVQDEYTTLVDRVDRPLFIHLDLFWTYSDLSSLLNADLVGYVAAEQVRDLIQVVFDSFVSESIQHLVYEMAHRLLERFPQLASVTFDAQNRTRDPVATSAVDPRVKVYTDPFSAYGDIKLTLTRSATALA